MLRPVLVLMSFATVITFVNWESRSMISIGQFDRWQLVKER